MAKRRVKQSKAARKVVKAGKRAARNIKRGKAKASPVNVPKSKATSRTAANANTTTTKRQSNKKQWTFDSYGKANPTPGTTAKSRKKAGEPNRPKLDTFSYLKGKKKR